MGRARLRCATCDAVLGVFGGRGLELLPAVAEIHIGDDGAVWLVCRACRARRRYVQGIAIVKADGTR